MTTLAFVTPDILTNAQLERINSIYLLADKDETRYGIKNYDKNSNPEIFVSEDGNTERTFRWDTAYDGARIVLDWFH